MIFLVRDEHNEQNDQVRRVHALWHASPPPPPPLMTLN